MSFFSFKTKPPPRPPPIHNQENQQAAEDPLLPKPTPTAIPPSGISLVNPNLQPEKARNFADIKLPQSFAVRFLGSQPATGIWGIQHTRKPVDDLVGLAKTTDMEDLTLLDLQVSENGIIMKQLSAVRRHDTAREIKLGKRPIERISYGVQDVVYPRIFAMICVKEKSLIDDRPFDCYVFHCENRIQSRKLAYCLAKAFKLYGENIKAANYTQTLSSEDSGDRSTVAVSDRSSKSSSTVESDA